MNKLKKIVIIGGGESGFGSAILAQKEGFDVFLSDKSLIDDKYKSQLISNGIPFEEGMHTYQIILNADEVIKSPGVPEKVEVVRKIREANIPIISEIEFAGRYTKSKSICITGSNGKTTTATLIYEILKKSGVNVGLAGNIGQSYAYSVAMDKFDWYVIEISSFQLDDMYDFRADIAVLTNITPDHLDRYDYKIENYINSKFRIAQNLTKNQCFIYCDDDKNILDYMSAHQFNTTLLPYSVKHSCKEGGCLEEDNIVVKVEDKVLSIMRSDINLKGLHNVSNIMASSLASLIVGVNPNSIKKTVCEFNGVEHRVEHICTVDNIEYINDSKATNVDSVWYALESMTRPVVWIAGGTDKGNDYAPLMPFASSKIHTLICMGIDNKKLIESFTGVIPNIYNTSSLAEAVDKIRISAKNGDVVLLSPACASFDIFSNYEDRGRKFKEAIISLTKK